MNSKFISYSGSSISYIMVGNLTFNAMAFYVTRDKQPETVTKHISRDVDRVDIKPSVTVYR